MEFPKIGHPLSSVIHSIILYYIVWLQCDEAGWRVPGHCGSGGTVTATGEKLGVRGSTRAFGKEAGAVLHRLIGSLELYRHTGFWKLKKRQKSEIHSPMRDARDGSLKRKRRPGMQVMAQHNGATVGSLRTTVQVLAVLC
jgi:hypothetical protein